MEWVGKSAVLSLGTGILGGVTREIVLERVAATGARAVEESIPPARLERADEIFLSGTTIRVAPVIDVDGRPVGDGLPGPVSRRLLRAYLDAVEEERRSGG